MKVDVCQKCTFSCNVDSNLFLLPRLAIDIKEIGMDLSTKSLQNLQNLFKSSSY